MLASRPAGASHRGLHNRLMKPSRRSVPRLAVQNPFEELRAGGKPQAPGRRGSLERVHGSQHADSLELAESGRNRDRPSHGLPG